MKEKGELSKKKVVLMTIVVVAIAASMVGVGTLAYFSASQTTGPHEFTTGSIDIQINGANPWLGNFNVSLSDLKPNMTRWGNVSLKNSGSNPADVWMRITNITNTSYGTANVAKLTDPLYGQLNISSVIHYGVFNWSNTYGAYPATSFPTAYVNPATYTVTTGMYGVTGTAAKEQWIYLGNIADGQTIFVNESFRMNETVTNWAQLMNMTFTVDFYAQQSEGDISPPAPLPTQLAGHMR